MLRVLAVLILHPHSSGADVAAEVGLKSGTLYPLLHRLTERGLVLAEVQTFGAGRTHYSVTSTRCREFGEHAAVLVAALTPELRQIVEQSKPRKAQSRVGNSLSNTVDI